MSTSELILLIIQAIASILASFLGGKQGAKKGVFAANAIRAREG